jgi:hypothetical protein
MDWARIGKIVLWLVAGLACYFLLLRLVLRKVKGYAPGWRIRCLSCGKTRPAGEAGMIRVAAVGKKYTIGRCGACGRLRWIVVERDPSFEQGTRTHSPD